MRAKRTIWLAALLAVTAGLVMWLQRRPASHPTTSPAKVAVPAQPSPRHSAIVSPPAPAPTVATPTPSPAPVDSARSRAELEASERMYAAHAPLRTPEVANPDSEANRRILAAMVAKALADRSGPADAPSVTKH